MAKLYPIGIQNFEKIRREGYLYIDKTALVCRLVKTGSYYFLSRPRRFGKSLLISTLEAYFQGKKDLFRGLAMEELEKDWIKYPILHLDLNTEKYDTPDCSQARCTIPLKRKGIEVSEGAVPYTISHLANVSFNIRSKLSGVSYFSVFILFPEPSPSLWQESADIYS